MKIYHSFDDLEFSPKGIVSIGVFEGLHLGHQVILDRMKQIRKEEGGKLFIVTFANHPKEIIKPENAPKRLISLENKIDFLREKGIDGLFLITFTEEWADITPCAFLLLFSRCMERMKWVVGNNFRFGKDRKGDVEFLRQWEQKHPEQFVLEIIPSVSLEGKKISTSVIRELIRLGELEKAQSMLGKKFFLEGLCVPGEKKGRTIGYPTMNLSISQDQVLPPLGVYQSHVLLEGNTYPAMSFLGEKSLGTKGLLLENHILDWKGSGSFGGNLRSQGKGYQLSEPNLGTVDLVANPSQNLEENYGKRLRVVFKTKLRESIQFHSLSSLKVQLEKDKRNALELHRRDGNINL